MVSCKVLINYNYYNQEINYLVNNTRGLIRIDNQETTNAEYLKDETNTLQCKNLTEIISITKVMLDFLSDNAFGAFISNTNYKPFDLGITNLLSAMNTLENILFCCKNSSFSDANVLIRKYRNDLFQYLYFLRACLMSP
jgi:hypothetical protein